MSKLLTIFLLLAVNSAAYATPLTQPQHERTQILYSQLRCMVCEGQSLAASDAPLANDMKQLIQDRVVAGDSNEMIISDLVASYGDTILMQPPVKQGTMMLWLMPLLLLGGGLLVMLRTTFGKS